MKMRIAVFFGGRSPEHDVSIVTGLQALDALNQERYQAIPVYVAPDGAWLIGEALRDRKSYIPDRTKTKNLSEVVLDVGSNPQGLGRLLPRGARRSFFRSEVTEFDVALIALHGLSGEDGRLQGLLEVANVPYTGMRPLASAVLMDKSITKRALSGLGIPLLPDAVLNRPAAGLLPSIAEIEAQLKDLAFPLIVKPVHLGSSIGVGRAGSLPELRELLPSIFKLDSQAIVERAVENVEEYNVAVRRHAGVIMTSAIERPKAPKELLDFKSKYLSGNNTKLPGQYSQGMLSLTRDIAPELPEEIERVIRDSAVKCFAVVQGAGVPRIDFLSNKKTGEIWLNEVNPCPGSFGFFLWEAAEKPVLFSDMLDQLIQEGLELHRAGQLPGDTTPPEARLFPRKE